MVDWTILGSWIIEGFIVACFVIAGIYIGMRFFGKSAARAGSEQAAAPESSPVLTETPVQSSGDWTPAPETGNMPAPVSLPLVWRELGDLPVHHASRFSDDDRVIVALDMPVAMLDNDSELVQAWVDTIGWTRIEQDRLFRSEDEGEADETPVALSRDVGDVDPDQLQGQLDEVLSRLHASAERRRGLRTSLHEGLTDAEQEG